MDPALERGLIRGDVMSQLSVVHTRSVYANHRLLNPNLLKQVEGAVIALNLIKFVPFLIDIKLKNR